MTEATVVELIHEMGITVLWLAGPLLVVGLAVGLLISVLQVVTSIHDPTLSFVPRILAVLVTGLILLSWMLNKIVNYTNQLFAQITEFV